MWNAGVGTVDFDQINESEAQVKYESRKNKNFTCEAVYKFKMSTLESPGLFDGLFESLEQSALTRTKATLLVKAMLQKVAHEREVKQNAKTQKTQVHDVEVSDMLMMKPPEMWKMALDDRVRGMLQSESSSKGKGKK